MWVCCSGAGIREHLLMQYSLVADHWQYAAMIAPCAVLSGIAATWTFRQPGRRSAAYAFGLSLLIAWAALTWRHSRTFANIDTLWNDTLAKNPSCWMAHNNFGLTLAERGQVDEAVAHYRKRWKASPTSSRPTTTSA